MTTLLLARHGETDWNRDHRWQGYQGPSLNATGRRQARELAARIADVDAIYSSDSGRAYETALILAERHGLCVRKDSRLREVDFGLWEGLTRTEIDAQFGGGLSRWLAGDAAPDGGETDDAMAERVLDALRDIAARHPDERIVVVTSGGPIRAVEAHLEGTRQGDARRLVATVPNCTLLEVVARDDLWERAV